MKRTNDYRARNHPAYWAFLVNRVAGLALTLFLPVHFWALGKAIEGEAALDSFLRFTDQPLFKFGEWVMVLLLAAHMAGGVRLLLIEFGPWSGLRKNWIAVGAGFAAATSMAFALALVF
ncbi:MAG: succinate dehydrogenase, cytochrome b556 subunit [Massilia sp.]